MINIMEAKSKSSGFIKIPSGQTVMMIDESELQQKLDENLVAEGDCFVKVQVIKKVQAVKGNIDLKKVGD